MVSPEESGKFETDTGFIHYELIGSHDETLTLLHNFMSTGRSAWGPLLDGLVKTHRVLLLDLPGHGRSLGHPNRFNHRHMAEQIASLMRTVEAEHGHIAGCSAGGMVAQLLVHHRMVEPASMILVSTTHSVNPQTTGESMSLNPKDFRASRNWMDATAQLHDEHREPGYFEGTLLPAFRSLEPQEVIDLSADELEKWPMPVCLIHGEEDEIFPVAIARSMARSLPNAELHVIPRMTHALIFRQPWNVQKLISDFLSRHKQR